MPDEEPRYTKDEWAHHALGSGSPFRRRTADGGDDPNASVVAEMRKNRRVNAKTAAAVSGSGLSAGHGTASLDFATGRPRDPLFYWKQNNLPYDFTDPNELNKVREFTRLLYQTDSMIGSCVDIYSKLPLLGMELTCKDEKLTEFYTDLFGFGEDANDDSLNYEDFCLDIGREYWSVGEAWPFATFNETLGVWEDEELLNPDDIRVERSPFLKEPRFFIRLPETLRKVLQTRQPQWEYSKLVASYPELVAYTNENQFMPVSNVLLRQIRFKGDTFNTRGIPLLTRAMRPVMQQEMLNAAMDAIADRLYTPIILVKLGASASDLGTDQPWIPTDDDLADFEEALDGALAADFRAIIYHFAIDMEPVMGREQMPDLTPDFERIEDRILQTFGLSKTLLTGAQAGQTYAADALNRDLISQLLTSYQKRIKQHYRQRALVVAEAQEHFDYDERNGKRYVKMEEILEVDEETGEPRIVEQPKLLIPDLHMKSLNLRDEDQERQFLELLRQSGVPISMRTRVRNLPVVLDDEVDQSQEEAVQLAVAEQETRKRTYQALRDQGLPIPDDLKEAFEPRVAQDQVDTVGQPERIPQLGQDPQLTPTPNLAATPMDMQDPQDQSSTLMPMMMPMAMPGDEGGDDGDQDQRPEESDEMRDGMPTAAQLFRQSARTRWLASQQERAELQHDNEGQPVPSEEPTGAWASPRHLGVRRYIEVDPDTPMEERYP